MAKAPNRPDPDDPWQEKVDLPPVVPETPKSNDLHPLFLIPFLLIFVPIVIAMIKTALSR